MPATGVAFATAQTTIGVALETTKGTPVAPVYWIPAREPKYKPNLMLIPDETLQGSMVQVYNLIRGLRDDQHGWESYTYLDSFPAFLAAELGSHDTVTGGPSATTLSSAATAGSSTIVTAGTISAGQWIVLGSFGAGNVETHQVLSVTGSYTVTLVLPLLYAHPTGAAVNGLTTHEFSLLNNSGTGNQPPSMTITDYDGEEWRQLGTAQIDELTIKGNATGLVTYECTFLADPSTTPSAPSPSFSNIQAPPGYTTAVQVAGVKSLQIEEWEFDFKRGTKPIPALTGTQQYYEYFAGPLACSGKMTVVESSGSPYLTQYLNGVQESFEFTLNDLKNGFALDILATVAEFKTGALMRTKEWVEVELEFECIPSTTDATAGGVSPVLCTVANSTTAAYW